MKSWLMWTIGSAAALMASAYAFLNFFAAADLGYDAYPGGKEIIARWGNAMLGFFLVGGACGVMAIRARWKNR
jgi:hypothetical protein